jgi:hypothetical protein
MVEYTEEGDLEELARVHMLIDKMAIGMKSHVTAQFKNGEKRTYTECHMGSYDHIVKSLDFDCQKSDWVQLAIDASRLWYLDWATFLGRNFMEKGDSPENYLLN